MDVTVNPGFTTYPTVPGHQYRLSGILRGQGSTSVILAALVSVGFTGVSVWPPTASLPMDWPSESTPAPADGEMVFRAEGTWTKSDPMPTSVQVAGGGTLTFFQVWDHSSDFRTVAIISKSLPTQASTNVGLKTVGAVAALGVAGLLAYAAIRRGRQPQFGVRENPIQYDSTTSYKGIPIHVHLTDDRYCADFSALERFVSGQGGNVCAPTRTDAISEARYKIDVALQGSEQPGVPKTETVIYRKVPLAIYSIHLKGRELWHWKTPHVHSLVSYGTRSKAIAHAKSYIDRQFE